MAGSHSIHRLPSDSWYVTYSIISYQTETELKVDAADPVISVRCALIVGGLFCGS